MRGACGSLQSHRNTLSTADSSQAGSGKAALSVLFFLHAGASALWIVPFANVMKAAGWGRYTFWGLIMGSLAAFISPLISGYLADRRLPAERLLAAGCGGAALFLFLAFQAVEHHWPVPVFLGLMLCYAVCNAPGFGLITTIVLARMDNPQREFGPVRAWATWGWMISSAAVSLVLHADHSTLSGYSAAGVILLEAIFCLFLPLTPPASARGPVRLSELFGWEALRLFRFQDHRVIFITTTLLSVCLAGMYPMTNLYLESLGDQKPSLTMSLAQLCEGIMLLALGGALVRFRLKWILLGGLAAAVLRQALLTGGMYWMAVISIFGHGIVFTLFYPTTQIYMKERVEPGLRAQAQALLTLLNNGVAGVVGYLAQDAWLHHCGGPDGTDWQKFWTGIGIACGATLVYFALSYRGQGGRGISRLTSTVETAER